MSFREKIHWAAFIGIAGAFGWYFLSFPWEVVGTRAAMGVIAAKLIPASIIILTLMSVTAAWLAIRYPKEAHLKEDEREYGIHLKGTHAAYYPLVLGAYAVVVAIFWGWSGAKLLNLLLAVIISAELVRVGWQLWLYRRS